MAGIMPIAHAYYSTPSPQELRRFFSNSEEMPEGDVVSGISRSSTNGQTHADSTTRPRRLTQGRQKLVFTDPVAFRYLEEDPDTIVLDRRRRLEGYELYIVEQWACSRTHPTFLICTYTGDMSRSVIVNVLSVPSDPTTWSPRLKLYFDAMSQFHAKPRDTTYGDIMVTNLAGFPSALTVISVPDGDVRKHREDFIVNEDLKRMGCTGRAAINVQPPQQSTIAKFHQLYRTSESIGIYQAVIELVKLCQKALVIYGKIQEAYTDGLLCDITEKAISEWWTQIGVYFYNTEPADGILGPSTVAALLGLLIGANNRLKSYGAPIGKDLFDLPSMKRAVGSFQKAAKLERTRRLDRGTLDKLHRATAKTASGEGWTVPRAVKSTLAEVSGKGGEMVMGIVGGKDKAGISEVETLDIDRFAQLVVGARMRWLWLGKSKPLDVRHGDNDEMEGRVFSTDDQGGFIWTSNKRESIVPGLERSETASSLPPHVLEGKSGLGRIREAVGGKLHNQRPGQERDDTDYADTPGATPGLSSWSSKTIEYPTTPMSEQVPPLAQALKEASPYANADKGKSPQQGSQLRPAMIRSSTDHRVPSYRQQLRPKPGLADSPRKKEIDGNITLLREELRSPKYTDFSAKFGYNGPQAPALRRSRSAIHTVGTIFENFPRQNRIGRQLSFSFVESSILTFPDVILAEPPPSPTAARIKNLNDKDNANNNNNNAAGAGAAIATATAAQPTPAPKALLSALAAREAIVTSAQKRQRRISIIQDGLIPYTESRVSHVEALDRDSGAHLEELNNLYYAKLEEYQAQRVTSGEVMGTEKAQLGESVRRLEVLGAKLDYELNVLMGRVQEVEDGVGEFERRVRGVEGRVRELVGWEREGDASLGGGGGGGVGGVGGEDDGARDGANEGRRSGADGRAGGIGINGHGDRDGNLSDSAQETWWQRVVSFVGSKKD